jgi:hypothetical protein
MDTSEATKNWMIVTGSQKRVHLTSRMSASNSGVFDVWAEATTAGNGTTINAFNNDRMSENTSVTTVYADPSGVTYGAKKINCDVVGSNSPSSRFGGNARNQSEWILKPNTKYVFSFLPDNDNTKGAISFEWYEE